MKNRYDGTELWLGGVYKEVVRPEKLVFTHAWDGPNGKPGPETLVTVTFVEKGSDTEMHFHQTGFDSVESRNGHGEGWNECFGLLDTFLRQQ
jgi:uncharacterized protein YndB with AHSA1/START domain